MTKDEIIFLRNQGIALEKITNLINEALDQNYSKHDPYWDSEHEIEADKLETCRLKLDYILSELSEICDLMRKIDHWNE
jgi:hypothetical protein